jgi:hypothetical protein
LFELMLGVSTPVNGGFVNRYVNKILVKLHNNNFVVFRVGVEEGADCAGGVQLASEDIFG